MIAPRRRQPGPLRRHGVHGRRGLGAEPAPLDRRVRVPRVALLVRGRVRAAPALPRRRPASPAAEEPDAWGGWFRHAAFPAEDLLGIAADGRGGGSSAAAAAPPPYDLADFRYQEASSGRNRTLLYWEEVVEAATAVPGGEETRAAAPGTDPWANLSAWGPCYPRALPEPRHGGRSLLQNKRQGRGQSNLPRNWTDIVHPPRRRASRGCVAPGSSSSGRASAARPPVAAGMETPEAEDRDTPCVMKKVPTGHYKWDDVSACFPVAASNNTYQKYYCSGTKEGGKACGRRIRTFCACSPAIMLCDEHYSAHYAARWGT